MAEPILRIRNLHARVGETEILRGVNLDVYPGQVHAIMGPNGSGKSTLAAVLAGREDYEVTEGEVLFDGKNLLEMDPEERAREGLFLAFQYPVEIPGVSTATFLKTALNELRKHRGQEPLDAMEFMNLMRERAALVKIDPTFFSRSVNEGFSGGEKKRNEIFQLAMLEPRLAILDETDSGLDIDALKIVADGVNAFRSPSEHSWSLHTTSACSTTLCQMSYTFSTVVASSRPDRKSLHSNSKQKDTSGSQKPMRLPYDHTACRTLTDT